MKERLVRMHLCRKFDRWLESIEDAAVKEVARKNTIITGGCIVSLLCGEEVNDYDLYFRTKEAAENVARYYVGKIKECPPTMFKDGDKSVDIQVKSSDDRVKIVIKSAGIAGSAGSNDYQYFETLPNEEAGDAATEFSESVLQAEGLDERHDAEIKPSEQPGDEPKKRYRPRFASANAVTLTDKVQIILRFFGEPDAIHENYDFVHCTSYWTSWDRKLVLRPEAVVAILTKDLRYVGSKYPICSLIRTRKFIKRGWNINAGQYLKMAWQVSKLNLNDPRVLEDQLVGVDAAYFAQLLSALSEKDTNTVDGAYLMTVIDRLF